jgi:hypothetical protein
MQTHIGHVGITTLTQTPREGLNRDSVSKLTKRQQKHTSLTETIFKFNEAHKGHI